jgi:hypothetical protein
LHSELEEFLGMLHRILYKLLKLLLNVFQTADVRPGDLPVNIFLRNANSYLS